MNVCVIPARGGSKRIPRKNIKEFNGKPIIAYSIEAALKSNLFERVIVSTDDEEIKRIAESYGAEVPYIRPIELSGDLSGTIPVIQHAIEWLEHRNFKLSNICCLYATAPFVNIKTLKKSYEMFKNHNSSYCFGVASFSFPIQRAVRIAKSGRINMFQPENFLKRSQDLEDAYHDAGQFCWGRVSAFKENEFVFSECSIPYVIPRHLVQDIDTNEDWIRAELMHQLLNTKGELYD